jgi:hypothetical protein
MKSKPRSPFYFSAYPLKALNEEAVTKQSSDHSPYLKSVLSAKTRTSSRVRVFPMVNPYGKTTITLTPETSELPKDIELAQKEWFNNYE